MNTSELVIFPALAAIFLVALLVAHYFKHHLIAGVMKALTALTVLAYCFLLYTSTPSTYALLILIAIALGVVGDILLIGRSSKLFLAGMLAFATGHLFYIGAFLQYSFQWLEWFAGALPLTLGLLAVYRWLKPDLRGAMKVAVPFYMLILGLMCSIAMSTRNEGQLTIIAIGGILFLVSDLFVATHRFKKPRFHDKLIGLPLYFAAQFVLATSIFRLTTDSPWLPI